MICTRFIYVDLGRTAGSVVRNMLHHAIHLDWIDARCHLPLSHDRKLQPSPLPSFAFVRNPFDWYISYYMRDLEIHRWRGAFRDWMFTRKPTVAHWMSQEWKWMGCSEVDYVGRHETLLDDMIRIFTAIMPDLVTEQQIREWFPTYAAWSSGCKHMEGIEQWLRDDLYDQEMVERVYKEDALLFEQFGYTFEERYYYLGGCGASCHEGRKVSDWESEHSISSSWAAWQIPK